MSRTRLDGGATVVLLDAIVRVPAGLPADYFRGTLSPRPALSLVALRSSVNRKLPQGSESGDWMGLVLAEEFFTVL